MVNGVSSDVNEVLIRPEAIRFLPAVDETKPTGEVVSSRNLGAFCLVDLVFPEEIRVTARVASLHQPDVGERCSLSLNLKQVFVFPQGESNKKSDNPVSI
jgi:hypothetical protein